MNNGLMYEFLNGRVAVNTLTKEDFHDFMLLLNNKTNLIWGSGNPLISTMEPYLGSDMCMNVDLGKLRRSPYKYFLEKGIEVVAFNELVLDEMDIVSKKQMNKNNGVEFGDVLNEMSNTYNEKNPMYGDSFGKSVEKYGMISALTRISDKFNRLEQMILNNNDGTDDERLRDTLLDMASYCVMTIIELEEK